MTSVEVQGLNVDNEPTFTLTYLFEESSQLNTCTWEKDGLFAKHLPTAPKPALFIWATCSPARIWMGKSSACQTSLPW